MYLLELNHVKQVFKERNYSLYKEFEVQIIRILKTYSFPNLKFAHKLLLLLILFVFT